MSAEVSIANAGERVEIHQTGREILCIAPTGSPTLSIRQSGGEKIALRQSMQSLILTESVTETLVIREPGGDSLIISDAGAGVASTPYGHPHTSADDGTFYYYAWQHSDGTQWKAQRITLSSLELRSVGDVNPQPQTLSEFQNIVF